MNAFLRIRWCGKVSTLLAAAWIWLSADSAGAQSKLWEFQAGSEVATSAAVGSDGTIYLGASDGRLYALSAGGNQKWQFTAGGAIVSSPAIGAGDTIYFGSNDRRVYAVSPTGAELWNYRTGGEVRSSPAIAVDGTVYVGSMDGKVYAIGTGGIERWQLTVGGAVFASPVVGRDGTVYVGSRDGRFHAISPIGQLKWSFYGTGQIDASAAIGPKGVIYFGTVGRRFYALTPSGDKLWELTTDSDIYSSPAAGIDGTVYAATYGGTVYAIKSDGTVLWKLTLPDRIFYSSIALATDGTIYVGAQDGLLYAITASGSIKWTFAAGSPIYSSSPTIRSDGSIVVGTKDGKVFAVGANSPPAPGAWPMFRRDQRHTASGFVERQLPDAYSGGLEMTVTLSATPLPAVSFYTVEDTPPTGWTVGEVSDGGYYDSSTRRVRFGPFLDGLARELTYTVTPPTTDSGSKTFVGSSNVGGVDRVMGGTHVLKLAPLHPADNHDVDGWMTIGEITAYGAAWKRGTSWSPGPSPVPTVYLLRAIELWSKGESYRYDADAPLAPDCWFPGAGDYPGRPQPDAPLSGTTAPNGSAWVSLPLSYNPGASFGVAIQVTPSSNVTVYAVEHQPPPGWAISNISAGGFLDAARQKVKWGPFFDAVPRTLSYGIKPPNNATNTGVFTGAAAFDGNVAALAGVQTVQPSGVLPADPFAWRSLPTWYAGGAKFVVTIQTAEIVGHGFYVIWDTPPQGWTVGQISNGGFYDPTSKTVKFGPFYDGIARTLTYEVTPPAGDTGTKEFLGMFNIDVIPGIVSGDAEIEAFKTHPADRSPVDGWIAINEATGYAAAWKRGTNWPAGPIPIPLTHATQAIALWRSGSAYKFDPAAAEPFCWVGLGAEEEPVYASPPLPPINTVTQLGSATATSPQLVSPDETVTVSIDVAPSTNVAVYAVEDQPPLGWTVVTVSNGGTFDVRLSRVKWGPFFDSTPRTLAYELRVPSNPEIVSTFTGAAAFDGALATISGQRKAFRSDAELAPRFVGVNALDEGTAIALHGIAGETYGVEASVDLQAWTLLSNVTVTNSTGTAVLVDPWTTNSPVRFYRAVWP
ncbi:MAG TPA: PQQ-binding-like beta-propeller repeat protein [Verrucomicrobiota bacterium]|nr:PQQ-binding-like beta-propeller repeat protein [Verrucomicrobiota bacterium]